MSMQAKYPKNKRPRVHPVPTGASLAVQSAMDECNINNIMKRYAKTGLIDHVNQHTGEYGDFADATDFLESQIIVQEASNMFNTIPAGVRKHFDNSPSKFLDFVQNEENFDAMVEMGLANYSEDHPAPEPTPVVPTPDPDAPADP